MDDGDVSCASATCMRGGEEVGKLRPSSRLAKGAIRECWES